MDWCQFTVTRTEWTGVSRLGLGLGGLVSVDWD